MQASLIHIIWRPKPSQFNPEHSLNQVSLIHLTA